MLKTCLAGGVAATCAKTLTAPLDRVKILFQAGHHHHHTSSNSPFINTTSTINSINNNNTSSNSNSGGWKRPFMAVKHIHASHGFQGLFQGHSVMVLRIFPSAAIRFMSYEQLKLLFGLSSSSTANSSSSSSSSSNNSYSKNGSGSNVDAGSKTSRAIGHFIAGSVSGNMAVLLTYPLEIVRTRMAFHMPSSPSSKYQSNSTINKNSSNNGGGGRLSISSVCRQVYSESGIRGFYRGFGATMLGVVPYAGAAFSTHHMLKDYLLNYQWATVSTSNSIINNNNNNRNDGGERRLKVSIHLITGGLAGLCGQTLAYPLDTVRHRMQLQGLAPHLTIYTSTKQALVDIWRREGVKAMFRGMSINYWKTGPANAVAFVVYDFMKGWLGVSDSDRGGGGGV